MHMILLEWMKTYFRLCECNQAINLCNKCGYFFIFLKNKQKVKKKKNPKIITTLQTLLLAYYRRGIHLHKGVYIYFIFIYIYVLCIYGVTELRTEKYSSWKINSEVKHRSETQHPYAATNKRSAGVKNSEKLERVEKEGNGSGEACKLQTCRVIEKRLLRNSTCIKLLLEEPVGILRSVTPWLPTA